LFLSFFVSVLFSFLISLLRYILSFFLLFWSLSVLSITSAASTMHLFHHLIVPTIPILRR
jgi:hypothetical protein